MTRMTIGEARNQANQAARGKLSALNILLRSLANGEVYDTYAGNPTSNLTPKAKGAWALDTTNNIWYRAKGVANTDWVAIGTHGLTAAELAYVDGLTAGLGAASKALVLDANGRLTTPTFVSPTEAGTGITAGVGAVAASAVQKIGDIFKTLILVDLTGLTSADSDLDVIGVEDTANPCHIGQITAAVNGTIFGGKVTCLETPASLDDIGIYSAGDGTLVYEDLITDESDEAVILTPAAQAAGDQTLIANAPPADSYLYLVNGAADTPDIFTAGKLMIELFGV